MNDKVSGIHHITAIAGNAKRNHAFYTQVLGLRFIKKTVNFDDPGTYHFYFGDEVGTPGTILTFFPWEGIGRGRSGPGMATEIGYSVPVNSLTYWADRLKEYRIKTVSTGQRFGEDYLAFEDPDGLPLTLITPRNEDNRKAWETEEVKSDVATRGFHSISLTLKSVAGTAGILTDVLEYRLQSQEGNRYRFLTPFVENASIVDLIESPREERPVNSAGTIHHVAFRVKDEDVLMTYREKVLSKGLHITGKIDRNYFFSLYFREPGGVLFELATENPGFSVDEPVSELGKNLKLPAQYESRRAEIEAALPPVGG